MEGIPRGGEGEPGQNNTVPFLALQETTEAPYVRASYETSCSQYKERSCLVPTHFHQLTSLSVWSGVHMCVCNRKKCTQRRERNPSFPRTGSSHHGSANNHPSFWLAFLCYSCSGKRISTLIQFSAINLERTATMSGDSSRRIAVSVCMRKIKQESCCTLRTNKIYCRIRLLWIRAYFIRCTEVYVHYIGA